MHQKHPPAKIAREFVASGTDQAVEKSEQIRNNKEQKVVILIINCDILYISNYKSFNNILHFYSMFKIQFTIRKDNQNCGTFQILKLNFIICFRMEIIEFLKKTKSGQVDSQWGMKYLLGNKGYKNMPQRNILNKIKSDFRLRNNQKSKRLDVMNHTSSIDSLNVSNFFEYHKKGSTTHLNSFYRNNRGQSLSLQKSMNQNNQGQQYKKKHSFLKKHSGHCILEKRKDLSFYKRYRSVHKKLQNILQKPNSSQLKNRFLMFQRNKSQNKKYHAASNSYYDTDSKVDCYNNRLLAKNIYKKQKQKVATNFQQSSNNLPIFSQQETEKDLAHQKNGLMNEKKSGLEKNSPIQIAQKINEFPSLRADQQQKNQDQQKIGKFQICQFQSQKRDKNLKKYRKSQKKQRLHQNNATQVVRSNFQNNKEYLTSIKNIKAKDMIKKKSFVEQQNGFQVQKIPQQQHKKPEMDQNNKKNGKKALPQSNRNPNLSQFQLGNNKNVKKIKQKSKNVRKINQNQLQISRKFIKKNKIANESNKIAKKNYEEEKDQLQTQIIMKKVNKRPINKILVHNIKVNSKNKRENSRKNPRISSEHYSDTSQMLDFQELNEKNSQRQIQNENKKSNKVQKIQSFDDLQIRVHNYTVDFCSKYSIQSSTSHHKKSKSKYLRPKSSTLKYERRSLKFLKNRVIKSNSCSQSLQSHFLDEIFLDKQCTQKDSINQHEQDQFTSRIIKKQKTIKLLRKKTKNCEQEHNQKIQTPFRLSKILLQLIQFYKKSPNSICALNSSFQLQASLKNIDGIQSEFNKLQLFAAYQKIKEAENILKQLDLQDLRLSSKDSFLTLSRKIKFFTKIISKIQDKQSKLVLQEYAALFQDWNMIRIGKKKPQKTNDQEQIASNNDLIFIQQAYKILRDPKFNFIDLPFNNLLHKQIVEEQKNSLAHLSILTNIVQPQQNDNTISYDGYTVNKYLGKIINYYTQKQKTPFDFYHNQGIMDMMIAIKYGHQIKEKRLIKKQKDQEDIIRARNRKMLASINCIVQEKSKKTIASLDPQDQKRQPQSQLFSRRILGMAAFQDGQQQEQNFQLIQRNVGGQALIIQ